MSKKAKLVEIITKEVQKIISEAKKSKKPTIEGITVEGCGTVEKDDVGKFYVVLNPTKDSTNENIMFETDVFNLAEKINKGLALENIRAILKKEDRAKKISEKLLRERQTAIADAKTQAEKLKGLRDEVKMKADKLKQTKFETQNAISKINENKNKKRK